jgi:hypothetical protein
MGTGCIKIESRGWRDIQPESEINMELRIAYDYQEIVIPVEGISEVDAAKVVAACDTLNKLVDVAAFVIVPTSKEID